MIVGDSGVGKTNLLGRFVNDSFDFSSKSTIGLDLSIVNMTIQGKRVRAQLWDTAGQERYRSITKRYYRGSVGALVVYDITKRDSFASISRWLDEFNINEAHPESIIMLVGNKSDLEKSRAISEEEAKAFAEKNGLMFMETSALDSTNVKNAFESLIHNIFDKLSSKLATLDDKKAEIMRGQAIQLSAPVESSENSKSSSCAC